MKYDPKSKKRESIETDVNREDTDLVEKIQFMRENSPEQNGEDF